MFRDAIDPWDWSRSYVLPDHVQTTIPRCGSIGSYGAHNAARGLLVEICYATAATPIALQYTETEIREPDTATHAIIVVVTATAELPDGAIVSATTRSRQHPRLDRDDDWTLQLNGVALDAEDRRYPPSPPFQGRIVAWHLRGPRSQQPG